MSLPVDYHPIHEKFCFANNYQHCLLLCAMLLCYDTAIMTILEMKTLVRRYVCESVMLILMMLVVLK